MAGRLRTIDARTLADAVLEPPGYAVKDLLVQGLHILAGAPKTGKSWLALWLCQQVADGEKVWGHPTQQDTVLYLCLEDGYRRLQDRLLDITEDPSENLYLATHAGTLADGLAGQIETFVREHGRVSLIVIDTLQKVREARTDSTYARDYADLARLKELADRCRTIVLLVHHLRKQYDSDPLNRVSGTAGMSGAADGTFILQREDRSSNYGTLFCTGRDIESKELKLQFDPMSHIWECREDEETARCALPGFVDSKNEEKTARNAGYLVVSHSGGGMLRQGTRKGIRRTPANRGMRAHRVVKGLDISEDVCHGMCP